MCVGDPDYRLPGNLGKVRAHRRTIEERRHEDETSR